jgi:hypothetical protein
MIKIMFTPFSVLGGILAGAIGKKLFEGVWAKIDEEQAPDPKYRRVRWSKLALSLLLEGAIFRVVRGLFDHGARIAFSRVVGRWPGEESPQEG